MLLVLTRRGRGGYRGGVHRGGRFGIDDARRVGGHYCSLVFFAFCLQKKKDEVPNAEDTLRNRVSLNCLPALTRIATEGRNKKTTAAAFTAYV